MPSKSSIKIVSRISHEFNSNLVINNITYHVQTEDLGKKKCRLITRVYRDGESVYSREYDYSDLVEKKGFMDGFKSFMEQQHRIATDLFTRVQLSSQPSKNDYFEEVKSLLRKGGGRAALELLEQALERFPEEPMFLSYYGCLTAAVGGDAEGGVRICRDALKKLDSSMPLGREFFYPVFYLNLGRACVKAGRRKEAIQAFTRGLKYDPENRELLAEVKRLGLRRKPPVPFLKRSNPLNKYVGLLFSKVKK